MEMVEPIHIGKEKRAELEKVFKLEYPIVNTIIHSVDDNPDYTEPAPSPEGEMDNIAGMMELFNRRRGIM